MTSDVINSLSKNMAAFGKLLAPEAFYAVTPDFHYEIYFALMDDSIKKVAIASPRGFSKSMMATKVNTIWRVLHKKPEEILPIVIISESETQSIDFLYDIKALLTESNLINETYAPHWGHAFDEEACKAYRDGKWTETQIILPNLVKITAKGTGQKIRGCNYRNVRPRLFIIDDFESEHNTENPESVVRNRKWVTNAVIPALSDDGRIIMIGNMITDDCFLAWVKENPGWVVLWYQAIDDAWTTPLWKERFPIKRLKDIRKYDYDLMDNPFGFWREYMNTPVPPNERSILPKDLNYWNEGVFDWR